MVIAILGLLTIAFQSRYIQTKVISFVTTNVSNKTGTDVSIERVKIRWFNKIILDNVYLGDLQNDTLFHAQQLTARLDSVLIFKKKLHFSNLAIDEPFINIYKADSGRYNFNFLIEAFTSDTIKQAEPEWRFFCNRFEIKHGHVDFSDSLLSAELLSLFNPDDINLTLDNIHLRDPNNAAFRIENFDITNNESINLNRFSLDFTYRDSIVQLNNIAAATKYSSLKSKQLSIDLKRFLPTNQINTIKFKVDISDFDLDLTDLNYIIPNEYLIGVNTNLSGVLSGSLSDIRGKDFRFSIENFTHIFGDFYLNGIDTPESAYLFINLNESYANLNEIRNLDLPPALKAKVNNLPGFLDNVGEFSYEGNFTGFIDDFVAYGTAYSNLGSIACDVSISPGKSKILTLNGKISTNKLDIGNIFNEESLGKLTLNGSVNGYVDSETDYDIKFDGIVNAIDFNNYQFQQITINGDIQNKRFIGIMAIDDTNLNMDFTGKLDLQSSRPVFEFISDVRLANLYQLGIIHDSVSNLTLKIDANFVGSSIDNVLGQLNLRDISYQNSIDQVEIDSLNLQIKPIENKNQILVSSDVLQGELLGKYNLINLGHSLIDFYNHYLPSSTSKQANYRRDLANSFDYNFYVKDVNGILTLLNSGLYIEPDFQIQGNFNSQAKQLSLKSDIKQIQNKNLIFDDIRINLSSNKDDLKIKAKLGQLHISDEINIYNLTVNSNAVNDSLDINVFWNNYGNQTFSGKLITNTTFSRNESKYPHIETSIGESKVYFNDSLWVMNKSKITIDSNAIHIDNLDFCHDDQHFKLNGTIADNKTDKLFAKIENVEFLLFEPLMGASYFNGKLNGEANIADLYHKLMLNMNLEIDDFSFNDGYLGEFKINSNWNAQTEKLVSDISLTNRSTKVIEAFGDIDILNSALDMQLNFDNSPIDILQVLMPSTFNNQQGNVDGKIHLHGSLLHIKHDGSITPVDHIGMGLTYLNTNYKLYDPIYFVGDSIVFRKARMYDEDGNWGILNGMFSHHTFNNMVYNISVKTDKILAMNTNSSHNDAFYGTAYASGDVFITGEGNDILLSGQVKSERGTALYIPFESGENAVKYDFIEFVNYSNTEQDIENEYSVVTSGLDMNFDLEITPDAKVQIIFNSQMGDIIKATGSGDLQVRVDRNYNINIYGNYEIEEGDYLFTFENFINKRFEIVNGSSIEWSGDAYNAIIDIDAKYKVKTTLDDLFMDTNQDIDVSRRIPIDCGIHLTEYLLKPNIDFTIDLPTVEERVRDEVTQLISTDEEKNKQIISLLILGRFYTPEFFAGQQTTTTGTNFMGTTGTELLSNQLSNWLSQISDHFDLGFNYRPGDETSEQQVELALSTQLMNDRLTIDTNFGNNNNQSSNNTDDFIGEFDVNFKLTDNGKIQLKAYNHSNDNIMNFDPAPYTAGIGVSYREEFNTFKDLWTNFKEAILPDKRKKKQKK